MTRLSDQPFSSPLHKPKPLTSNVSLPDFRNLGVLLRTIALVEGLLLVVAYACSDGVLTAVRAFVSVSLVAAPALLAICLALFSMSPRLAKLNYRTGVAMVLGVTVTVTFVVGGAFAALLGEGLFQFELRLIVVALLIALAVLGYFNWRHRVLSPALSEARLMALQARIRPHFLFNSLNTVLALMRSEPGRAELVLENLAELYRALLSESASLVPLGREMDLARAYAEIETMRLGPRLKVSWQCQSAPRDALVPPLILQPLLENAVYHGVEPAETGGEVNVTAFLKNEQLNLVVRNPCVRMARKSSGNRMALNNIRERLALHFDAEAEMSAYESGGEFVVQIRLPYKHV